VKEAFGVEPARIPDYLALVRILDGYPGIQRSARSVQRA
jgi:hypothetical protein